MTYDRTSRLLHAGLAAGITLQMLSSLLMVDPRPGRLANGWFELHENLGVALLVLVGAYWLWSFARALAGGAATQLFPWFSRAKMAALAADARSQLAEMRSGHLPSDVTARPLPSAVHGLGLLIATAMAATGTLMALFMAPDGAMAGWLHAVKEIHESIATLMWAYLIGHPLMGLLHQLAGHHTLSRMFRFGASS